MRGFGFKIATGVGAIAPSCAAFGLVGSSSEPDAAALLGPLPPEGEGQSLCLAGSNTGQPVDVEDWSKAKLEPTEPHSPDGKPYMRQVPPLLSDGAVHSSTLELVCDDHKADDDWISARSA